MEVAKMIHDMWPLIKSMERKPPPYFRLNDKYEKFILSEDYVKSDKDERFQKMFKGIRKKYPDLELYIHRETKEQLEDKMQSLGKAFKEVDMGEKKFRVGERVRVREDIAKCHGYENVGDMAGRIVTIVRATEDGYNLKESGCLWLEETLESTKLSREELVELATDYCKGKLCKAGCEMNKLYINCGSGAHIKDFFASGLRNKIIEELMRFKAQKEQEKKWQCVVCKNEELLDDARFCQMCSNPVDLKESDIKVGDIVKTSTGKIREVVSGTYTRTEAVLVNNVNANPQSFKIICKAEDRVDRVKLDQEESC